MESHRVNSIISLLFLTFSALVANPKKLLYTVANPARGLLNRENYSGVFKTEQADSAFQTLKRKKAVRR